jgi:hypothetical protein
MYLVVPLGALAFGFLLFEVGLRTAVEPSPRSYGLLRGHDLPPVRLIPGPAPRIPDPATPWPDLVVDGVSITHGDLLGSKRHHPEIGYVWEENFTSSGGWWRTNDLGARGDRPTSREVPPGKRRVAIFGDSFAAATRVAQGQAWSTRLETLRPDLDVVNLGTDGYSSAQSFLRYQEVSERIEMDIALFFFVPWHDPWRDVNVLRSLGEQWTSYTTMPRFVLEGDGLRLVTPLYEEAATIYERNYPEPGPDLLAHLRAYDRFFIEEIHVPPPGLGHLVAWKLFAAHRAELARRRLRMEIGTNLDGEAFEITRRIFAAATREGTARGQRVVVVVLPVQRDLTNLERSEPARERWRGILQRFRDAGVETLDLSPALLATPPEDRDAGYDGTHYGPRANLRIAEALAAGLPK